MIALVSYNIVKLGGSVITFKDRSPPKTNHLVVEQIASELKGFPSPLIVILGGGAHGHQAAQKFGYGDSDTPASTLLSGIPLIRHNMTQLSHEVETIFQKYQVPSVVISPFNFILMNNGIPCDFEVHIILKTLQAGFNVIIHGDVCYDEVRGSSILSGDTIVSEISKKIPVNNVLLGTDVDGVYSDDPKTNPEASLIPSVDKTNLGDILEKVGPSKSTDVTGGMFRKIQELVQVSKVKQIVIFNLLVPGRLKSLLSEKETRCTIIQD